MKVKNTSFLPAIAWLIIATILLLLPGTNFPEAGLFYFPHRDKLVHLVFFFLFSYIFSRPLKFSSFSLPEKKSWFLSIALYVIAYGIIIEFIQKYFIPNRSFDIWDIVFDAAGSLLGYWWSLRFFTTEKAV